MPKRRLLYPESVYARHNLEEWLSEELGVQARHRRAIWNALPCKEFDINSIDSIPRVVYEKFNEKFVVTTTRVVDEKTSEENGAKLVIETQDGHLIETVIIQHYKRGQKLGRATVCVSSQVGCQMGCTFCATGTMGKIANLTAAEIVEQVHHAKLRFPHLSSVVFMGMGEPLDNFDNVKEAIFSLHEPNGFAIPLGRITLSTVGVTHGILRLARECPEIQLALSLHAPNDEIRTHIVPSTKAFSVKKIMDAVAVYQDDNKRSVMIEYIMIDDVNSSPEHAHELGKLVQGRNCIVNLIPYNPTSAGDRFNYRSPPNSVIDEFQDIIFQYKGSNGKAIRCTVRWSSARGQDIDAACGQLALKNLGQGSTVKANNAVAGARDIEDFGQIGDNSGGKRVAGRSIRNGRASTVAHNKCNGDGKSSSSSWQLQKYHWYMLAASTGIALVGGSVFYRRRR